MTDGNGHQALDEAAQQDLEQLATLSDTIRSATALRTRAARERRTLLVRAAARDDLTHPMIADAMGCSVANVDKELGRARAEST